MPTQPRFLHISAKRAHSSTGSRSKKQTLTLLSIATFINKSLGMPPAHATEVNHRGTEGLHHIQARAVWQE
ncbi:Hypothetical predicted protein [Podarcis lilfordi]|uniref:Uncharacterized protein n=1 Tax=Podarcis lilfordi TaxID=74358 RepID=A0AA35K7M8_9SAUR|nr:Hypothetical predicted protein [Podarcis lilfordi]